MGESFSLSILKVLRSRLDLLEEVGDIHFDENCSEQRDYYEGRYNELADVIDLIEELSCEERKK